MAKSRIALANLALVCSLPAHAKAPDPHIQRYETMTRVAVRCSAPQSGTDITVCGHRRADRWRVPYLTKEAGDPAIQNVPGERAALIARTTPCQERSPFLVGCGPGVGLKATIGLGSGSKPTLRPLSE